MEDERPQEPEQVETMVAPEPDLPDPMVWETKSRDPEDLDLERS